MPRIRKTRKVSFGKKSIVLVEWILPLSIGEPKVIV